jgi:molybdenum cofactor biosynthesis enzyme MoaA
MIRKIYDRDKYIHKVDVEKFDVFDRDMPILHKSLFGHNVNVYDEEWMWHLHLKTTDLCNAKCDFCVEKSHRNDKANPDQFLKNTELMLNEMQNQGILFSVSVTGGEPTICGFLGELLDILSRFDIHFLTMNTNGIELKKYSKQLSQFNAIDISRHGFNDDENNRIFSAYVPTIDELKELKNEIFDTQMRIQAVTTLINSPDDMNKFIDVYSFADDISFRRLMKLSKEYGHNYSINDSSYTDLIEYAFNNWEFKEQVVQDYYVYEIYNNGETDVTFSYSNMELLRKYEVNENDFYREFIIHPNGYVSGSWQFDNRILLK